MILYLFASREFRSPGQKRAPLSMLDNDYRGEIYFRLGKSERQVGKVHSLRCIVGGFCIAQVFRFGLWPRNGRLLRG